MRIWAVAFSVELKNVFSTGPVEANSAGPEQNLKSWCFQLKNLLKSGFASNALDNSLKDHRQFTLRL